MQDYFSRDWTGSAFVLFGPAHLGALAVAIALNLLLVRRFRGAPQPTRRRMRWILVAAMWTHEIVWHLWNVATGQWTLRTMLPLHLCSAMVWISGVLLLTSSRRLYPLVYFLGIGGAVQALLTPDLNGYNFPHYRFFETFFAHTMIVTAAVWMTFVERFRPTWRSLGRTLLVLHISALVVFAINSAIGSNYLFINGKPPFPTLLDALPPWPLYLPVLSCLAIAICLALYVPWALRDARSQPASVESRPETTGTITMETKGQR